MVSRFFTERSVRPTCLQNCPVGLLPRPIFSPIHLHYLAREGHVTEPPLPWRR